MSSWSLSYVKMVLILCKLMGEGEKGGGGIKTLKVMGISREAVDLGERVGREGGRGESSLWQC